MSDIATEKILKSPLFHPQPLGNTQGFGSLKRRWQFSKELLLLLKANDIHFQLTVDSDESFVGFGIAEFGMLLLPHIKSSLSIFGKGDNLRK